MLAVYSLTFVVHLMYSRQYCKSSTVLSVVTSVVTGESSAALRDLGGCDSSDVSLLAVNLATV